MHSPELTVYQDDDEASGEEATTGEFGDTWSWLRNELDAERVITIICHSCAGRGIPL